MADHRGCCNVERRVIAQWRVDSDLHQNGFAPEVNAAHNAVPHYGCLSVADVFQFVHRRSQLPRLPP